MAREHKTTTTKDNPSGATPRYTYTSPPIKTQPGLPKELGTNIESYRLPVTDVQTHRRNYLGYTESQPFSLEDIRGGDISGSTETDSATETKGSGGYTKINQKKGKVRNG